MMLEDWRGLYLCAVGNVWIRAIVYSIERMLLHNTEYSLSNATKNVHLFLLIYWNLRASVKLWNLRNFVILFRTILLAIGLTSDPLLISVIVCSMPSMNKWLLKIVLKRRKQDVARNRKLENLLPASRYQFMLRL